ncbi:MAG TPA: ATP-binding protein [Candidatus Limnocylindria bacterium]|nr:ATP-binding protein [Candidatus Limnocylindria bacterium]
MSAREPSERDRRADPGIPPGSPTDADAADVRTGDRLTSLLDDLPAGIAVLAGDLRIVESNRALAAMIGMPGSELAGRSFESLLSVPARILFQTHVFPALMADGRVEEVLLTLGPSGDQAVPVLLNAERSEAGGEAAYVAVMVRIRARSQWERELLDATRALERERASSQQLAEELAVVASDLNARLADDARSREFRDAFVGVVSHELRTPITTIFGMSHLLRERHRTMAPDAVTAGLDDIQREADRLRRLTEDLLVLSRAEGSRLEVSDDPLVLGHVLRATVKEEAARSEGHRFETSIDRDLPLVLGESIYVEQVLRNFLSNAVKYSPAGSLVRIEAARDGDGVAVRVIDEGRGLGDEPSEQLWELFFRSADAMRQASGAGIGLFVSRELVQAMGGRVWARPAGNEAGGAEFGFWLPAIEVEEDT